MGLVWVKLQVRRAKCVCSVSRPSKVVAVGAGWEPVMREVDIKRGGRLRAAAPEEVDLKTGDREKKRWYRFGSGNRVQRRPWHSIKGSWKKLSKKSYRKKRGNRSKSKNCPFMFWRVKKWQKNTQSKMVSEKKVSSTKRVEKKFNKEEASQFRLAWSETTQLPKKYTKNVQWRFCYRLYSYPLRQVR